MKYTVGSDEVGLGAYAGPLVVCATAVPVGWAGVEDLGDSKELKKRKKLHPVYARLQGVRCALMHVSNTDIDRIGLRPALLAGHAEALRVVSEGLEVALMIVDGNVPIPGFPHALCEPKADAHYPAVMAASVIAKVNRDLLMVAYHAQYPVYGFRTNVGYGSAEHTAGLVRYGACPLHRRSYRPIAELPETR